MEIDLDFLDHYEPLGRPRVTSAVVKLARFLIWLGKSTPRCIHSINVPDRPVIFATNHTHVLDFLPLWIELLQREESMVGWVKARMYKRRFHRLLMRAIGNNFPLVSRGYLISADFRALFGRPPGDDEYRHLRDCVDGHSELPDEQPYTAVATTPRDMLGRPFRPDREDYATAMGLLFYQMMARTIESTRRCVRAGYHLHIYPEGEVERHLTRGHTGIVQTAIGLGIPVVPVGISGADRAFIDNSPLTRGGVFRLRFGEAMDVGEHIGDDFRPFHPDDERRYRSRLQADVDEIMVQLDKLVDREYGYTPASFAQHTTDVQRFY